MKMTNKEKLVGFTKYTLENASEEQIGFILKAIECAALAGKKMSELREKYPDEEIIAKFRCKIIVKEDVVYEA